MKVSDDVDHFATYFLSQIHFSDCHIVWGTEYEFGFLDRSFEAFSVVYSKYSLRKSEFPISCCLEAARTADVLWASVNLRASNRNIQIETNSS